MLKAADSFRRAGYQVRVVSTNCEPWAKEADRQLDAGRELNWTIVDYSRASAISVRLLTGARFRIARRLAKLAGPQRLSLPVLGRATGRVFPELVRAACARPADFFYGGGSALAATEAAARQMHVPFAVDLEDLHSDQCIPDSADGRLANALGEAAERRVFREAAFITTASDGIADAYEEKYGTRPVVTNNTFPLPQRQPDFSRRNGSALRFYWFSQSIGCDRGLEEFVQAAGLAGIGCELHLRGKPVGMYLAGLRELAARSAPNLTIVHHDPAPPDQMIELCRGFDVGLALERADDTRSRALCLSNKALTYILAGLAVVFTDTPGQRRLALDLGPGALLYKSGDVRALADGLKAWAGDDASLLAARKAAWAAACRRWHWQHPEEEGALLRAVKAVASRNLSQERTPDDLHCNFKTSV
jgi:glycosyltransferase involved in cell wall biosynthesis